MKKLHVHPVFVFLLIGSVLFFGCEKQETETLTTEENISSDYKASGGYALYFDGVDDYVMIPDDPSLDLTGAFTIAAWVNIESYVEWASIVTKGANVLDSEGNWIMINNYTVHQSGPLDNPNVYDYGYLRFTGDNSEYTGLFESETQIQPGVWHFVALTWDGEFLKFYLDGELDGMHALGGTFAPNDLPLHIGVDFPGGDEYWWGTIDEVRIWNEALKQTHIQAAMNGHATPLARALVGYWRFDEGEGNVAKDRSKYKNHGVLEGNPIWVNHGAP